MPRYLYAPHPLLLPNIVSNVLQNFHDETFLAQVRLVCHCWNVEACSLLRRLTTVKFKDEESVESYHNIYQHTQSIFGIFPHSSFNFKSLHPNSNISNSQTEKTSLSPALNKFFEQFGEHIMSLHVPIRSGSSRPIMLLDSALQKVPNITTLGLNIQYFHDVINPAFEFSQETILHLQTVKILDVQIEGLEISEESALDLLSLMFRYLPNLQKLSFPGDIRRISKVGLVLRDAVLDLDSSVSSSLVRFGEWDFKTRLLEEDALKLLCTNFPMKTLYVDLWNPEDDIACISSELMAGLLRKWNQSLERLSMEFPWRKEISFHFHFPLVMEKLTFLYLGGLEGSLLVLLNKLPSLKRLELSQLELLSILPKPDGEEYPQVKQLRLDFCTGQSGGIMSRFSRIFPQLRSLNINHATNEAARMIFQKMNNLVRLRMHGHELTDSGMCGFSESMIKEKDFLTMTPAEGNSFRKYAFIADLKELQYLKLDAIDLTEVTVRHALVHCSSLRIVKMDCTGGGSDSATKCRKFRLAEYGKHLVEEEKHAVVEMKEDPPLDDEALEFFNSRDKFSIDNYP